MIYSNDYELVIDSRKIALTLLKLANPLVLVKSGMDNETSKSEIKRHVLEIAEELRITKRNLTKCESLLSERKNILQAYGEICGKVKKLIRDDDSTLSDVEAKAAFYKVLISNLQILFEYAS